jgi:hypothetical protein
MAVSRASRLSIFRWTCSDSVICRPTFMTGFSAVIGSWKIIAISVAHRACGSSVSGRS